mmetsp:Transcript_26186/g.57593  ORF Transcript_26186/g.57593 Transcript_26186/m.57593 type:complete len:490 (-) Transcript_26186:125-1594(-)
MASFPLEANDPRASSVKTEVFRVGSKELVRRHSSDEAFLSTASTAKDYNGEEFIRPSKSEFLGPMKSRDLNPRAMKKGATYACIATHHSRRQEVQLPHDPESIATFLRLNEELYTDKSKAHVLADTSEAALDLAWKPNPGWRGWHVRALVPSSTELPMSVRRLRLLPASGESAPSRLRSHGIAAITTKGVKGVSDTSIGQDNFSVSMLPGGWLLLCVMDGHGDDGQWPSLRGVRTLPYFLRTRCGQYLRHGQPAVALTLALRRVQEDLIEHAVHQEFDLQACGCTAICVLSHHSEERVWVASIGDSRAAIISAPRNVVRETVDHKCAVEAERDRVLAAGGEILEQEYDDGSTDWRINAPGEDYPGIAMTRSLGDLSVKECGVIAEPEISEWSLTDCRKALIILASDGVWEFLTTEEVAGLIFSALDQGFSMEAALDQLVKESRKRWLENEGDYCDDITAVVASVDEMRRAHPMEIGCCAGWRYRACNVL